MQEEDDIVETSIIQDSAMHYDSKVIMHIKRGQEKKERSGQERGIKLSRISCCR
jgi:hypothetical protein